MTLHHSVPDWCFFKEGMDGADYYRKVKAAGYEAVEMVAPARRPLARAAGLQILNHPGPGMQEGLNNPANHARLIPEIQRAIRDVAADRIPALIIFSGNRFGPSDADGLAVCTDAVRQLIPAAQKARVTLLFEVLNSFDHPGYQADHSRYAFELVRAINAPQLKVLYDIYHMHRMGEDVAKDVVANVDIIAHLHTAGSPRRDFPGERQAIDYASLVPAVHHAGYRGFWGHEFNPAGDPVEEAARALTRFEWFVGKGQR
jgi:hydroxypyruvate isomerase